MIVVPSLILFPICSVNISICFGNSLSVYILLPSSFDHCQKVGSNYHIEILKIASIIAPYNAYVISMIAATIEIQNKEKVKKEVGISQGTMRGQRERMAFLNNHVL